MSGEFDVELASASVLLLHQINVSQQSRWCPVSSSQFDRIGLCLRPSDASYYLRIHGNNSPSSKPTIIEICKVAHYVIKTRIWHELTMSDGRQMALYLSGDGVARFFSVLQEALRTLGKYDRLMAPHDVFGADDLKAQRIVLIKTVSVQDLRDEFAAVQQRQQPIQQQESDDSRQENPYISLRESYLSDDSTYEQPSVVPDLGQVSPPTDKGRPAPLAVAQAVPPKLPPRPRTTYQPKPGFADAKHKSLPLRLHPNGAGSSDSDATGPWTCGRCTLNNVSGSFACAVCEASRSDVWQCPVDGNCPRGMNHVDRSTCSVCGAWKCPQCTSINFRSLVSCVVCYYP
jgi:hypothetical protein